MAKNSVRLADLQQLLAANYPSALLLFQAGAFAQAFNEDALILHKGLEYKLVLLGGFFGLADWLSGNVHILDTIHGRKKMMRKSLMVLCLMQLVLPVFLSHAQDVTKQVSARDQLLESLGAGATLVHAAPAAMAGFEELIVRDGQGADHVFYLSKDGNMAFSGSLLDVRHKKNVTQASYRAFVATEIAKGIHSRQQDFIPYRKAKQHEETKPPLYVFLGPSCPACLKLWDNTLPNLSEKYDVRLSYGGLGSLGVKQVRKAMGGWCLTGDKRRNILSNSPLVAQVESKGCKPGMIAFNRMKETFGRYIRRIPVAYNEQGEIVPLL